MDPVTVKIASGKITYDDQRISLKRGLGATVTTHLHQIVGVDLQLPGFMRLGRLNLRTLSSQHSGVQPKNPWSMIFNKTDLPKMQALYDHLMAHANTKG